jgi:hypothetical protein
VKGLELRALLDGQLIMQVREPAEEALTGGGVALIVDTGSISTEEIRVVPL